MRYQGGYGSFAVRVFSCKKLLSGIFWLYNSAKYSIALSNLIEYQEIIILPLVLKNSANALK